MAISLTEMDWKQRSEWGQASTNTLWCLVGCAAGDLGTILFFQLTQIPFPVVGILLLAMLNGILASITLETLILLRRMPLASAFRTAIGMSLISMITMEVAMNAIDYWLVGGARLTWWVLPFVLLAGFLAPLPYNYWRLVALGRACH